MTRAPRHAGAGRWVWKGARGLAHDRVASALSLSGRVRRGWSSRSERDFEPSIVATMTAHPERDGNQRQGQCIDHDNPLLGGDDFQSPPGAEDGRGPATAAVMAITKSAICWDPGTAAHNRRAVT